MLDEWQRDRFGRERGREIAPALEGGGGIMPFDLHKVAVQLTVGIGAVVAMVAASVLGLLRRRPGWLFVAAICALGPYYYLLGLSAVLATLGALMPVLLVGAGVAMQRGRPDFATVAVAPVYLAVFVLLLMYGMAAAS